MVNREPGRRRRGSDAHRRTAQNQLGHGCGCAKPVGRAHISEPQGTNQVWSARVPRRRQDFSSFFYCALCCRHGFPWIPTRSQLTAQLKPPVGRWPANRKQSSDMVPSECAFLDFFFRYCPISLRRRRRRPKRPQRRRGHKRKGSRPQRPPTAKNARRGDPIHFFKLK